MAFDKSYTEEDVRTFCIDPSLREAGWGAANMKTEHYYTDGRVVVQGPLLHRKKGKKIDYLLFGDDDKKYPIAIVEAKSASHTHSDGIQQAMDYAIDNDVHFAYSSNGEYYTEHDFYTGKERVLKMDDFPTPDQLRQREAMGKMLPTEAKGWIDVPYYSAADSHEPRYYQRIAINRTIEAIATGRKRILLVMATGTGKTYTAFQIIHRLHKKNENMKILYLADRNNLIDQTMRQDFKPFQKFMTKIQGRSPKSGYELYMSLYGQWVKPPETLQEGERQPYEHYSPDFFDLIVVDECHRSSINEDKEWHKILNYFSSAIQLGLTATPKAAEGANNIEYFGEPIYTYSLRQGIEDGFLAPYRVTKSFLDIDLLGYIPEEGEVDLNNYPIEPPIFTQNEIGRTITINLRQKVVAQRITEMLHHIGRFTKTIVFCPQEDEAAIMRDILIQMNQDLVKQYPNYVVRITGTDKVGPKLLDDFINPHAKTPVIATTSEMLSTGVDCKTCGLIVIDKQVSSMTTFKQMIGRGTRIFEYQNKGKFKDKMNFEILDFRNVTTLFNDPDFDGPADVSKSYHERKKEPQEPDPEPPSPESLHKPVKYCVEGESVDIVMEEVMYLGEDGRTMSVSKLTDFTRKTITGKFPTLELFRGAWLGANKKQVVLDSVEGIEELLTAVREQNPRLDECDDFDVICHVAYDQKPLTRKERIEGVKKRNYLAKYEGKSRQVIEALMDKYGESGVVNIENPNILQLNPFSQIGKRPRIINGVFKGMADYEQAIRDLENQLYLEA